MIITLARECGCQGDLIGQELAKMYQLPFYDRKKVSDLIRSKGTLSLSQAAPITPGFLW